MSFKRLYYCTTSASDAMQFSNHLIVFKKRSIFVNHSKNLFLTPKIRSIGRAEAGAWADFDSASGTDLRRRRKKGSRRWKSSTAKDFRRWTIFIFLSGKLRFYTFRASNLKSFFNFFEQNFGVFYGEQFF